MQQRHTESGTIDRPGAASKTRSSTPEAIAKPIAEKPKEQRDKGKIVEFRLSMPHARMVAVVGSFNNWDTKRNLMQKEGASWKTSLPLPPGRYEYRFVADGQWLSDPNAKESVGNDFGSTNSVLVV